MFKALNSIPLASRRKCSLFIGVPSLFTCYTPTPCSSHPSPPWRSSPAFHRHQRRHLSVLFFFAVWRNLLFESTVWSPPLFIFVIWRCPYINTFGVLHLQRSDLVILSIVGTQIWKRSQSDTELQERNVLYKTQNCTHIWNRVHYKNHTPSVNDELLNHPSCNFTSCNRKVKLSGIYSTLQSKSHHWLVWNRPQSYVLICTTHFNCTTSSSRLSVLPFHSVPSSNRSNDYDTLSIRGNIDHYEKRTQRTATNKFIETRSLNPS